VQWFSVLLTWDCFFLYNHHEPLNPVQILFLLTKLRSPYPDCTRCLVNPLEFWTLFC
jgi:hypothetical protein